MDIMSIPVIASGRGVVLLRVLLWQIRQRPAADPRLLADKAVAEDRAASLRAELDTARAELETAHAARLEAEKQAAGLRSELAHKAKAFETLAETATQAAKAAALESAAQMSPKLLADHKREAERSEERRGGKSGDRPCRPGWSPEH